MTPTLLYDGTCRFCIAGTRRLQRLVGGRLRLVPAQSDEASALLSGDLAPTDRQMLLVVGGTVYGGAEAVAQALRLSPWWRLGAGAYYLPGLRQLADSAYRAVAARRHCLGGACSLP